jgi:dihydroflavonol-4-reductase
MRILVTGATGFIGSAVVRRLLAAGGGHHVRVLARSNSNRRHIENLPVETVLGDLKDRRSLQRAVKGCQAVFHVAADYRLWVPDPAGMYAVNVKGTENLMRAALDAGVQRVVYTSSVATIKLSKNGTPADEQNLATLNEMVGHYKRSKFMAEALVLDMAQRQNLPAVIVNPSTPVGPYDLKPTPTGKMILQAVSGRMPAYVDTGLNFVHVDDVAAGHLLAFERGRIAERYILGGENMTLRHFLETICRIIEKPAPRIRLSVGLVLPFAYLNEMWVRMINGSEPLLTVDGVRMAANHMYFSSQKAERELGYKPRPAREAFCEAVAWFRAGRYVEMNLTPEK